MAQLRIEYWPVERISSYGRKLKKHDTSVQRMMDSIQEFGFRIPVLVTADGTIVDGELRVDAARLLGLEALPVILADDLSEAQIKAFRLMVNTSSDWSRWDKDAVVIEIKELHELQFDLRLTGFDSADLDAYLELAVDAGRGEVAEDDVPEVPVMATSAPGDVWLLGQHRLMCGDATQPGQVAQLMAGEAAHMVFTDPPYNVDYEGAAGKIKNDKMASDAFFQFLLSAFSQAFSSLQDGGAIYVAHADTEWENFRRAFVTAGFKLSVCLVWRKNQLVIGRSDYQYQHEPILYGWKPTGAHKWFGRRDKTSVLESWAGECFKRISERSFQINVNDEVLIVSGDNLEVEALASTVIHADKPSRSVEHPTMKPVGLVERFIRNSSMRGERVLDLFGGSGSTLIACEKAERCARVMELDPRFCDVILERWLRYTGLTAVLEGDGRTFAEIKGVRG